MRSWFSETWRSAGRLRGSPPYGGRRSERVESSLIASGQHLRRDVSTNGLSGG